MDIDINFGRLIKKFVTEQAGTVEEEAKRLEYSLAGLNKIFAKKDVSTSVLKKIAKTYRIDIRNLLQNNGPTLNQRGRNVGYVEEGQAIYESRDVRNVKGSDGENLLLKAENEALKRENELLRRMVDILEKK